MYLLCEISQCVVMTLNPGVGMGIINKFYYIIFISIVSVPAVFAASITGSILLSFTKSVIIWTCRTKVQLGPCNSNYIWILHCMSTCFGSTVCSQVWRRRSNRDLWNFTVVLTDMKTPEQLVSNSTLSA